MGLSAPSVLGGLRGLVARVTKKATTYLELIFIILPTRSHDPPIIQRGIRSSPHKLQTLRVPRTT